MASIAWAHCDMYFIVHTRVYVFSLCRPAASYFMTYHDICVTSDDYVQALKQARIIANNISTTLGVEVYPYR